MDVASPSRSVILEEDSRYPLDWIWNVSFDRSGDRFLIVQEIAGTAYLYNTSTGKLLRTIRFDASLSDSVVMKAPTMAENVHLLRLATIDPRLIAKLRNEVHSGFFKDDSTIVLAGKIEVFDGNPVDGAKRKLSVTTFVTFDTNGRVRSVTPTDYPSLEQFQNSTALAYSSFSGRWFVDHEYWPAYVRMHYDSVLMVASFNETGHDKRMSCPVPKALRRSSLDYGPGKEFFILDSLDRLRIVYSCLPDVYDAQGSRLFTLSLPVNNQRFLEATHATFGDSAVQAQAIWDKQEFGICSAQILSHDSIFIATSIIHSHSPWRYEYLLQIYDGVGRLVSQCSAPDNGPLGKPRFAGITPARVPYLICDLDGHYVLHFLKWES